jgi:quercetin dioxygenase-like cupin family protein
VSKRIGTLKSRVAVVIAMAIVGVLFAVPAVAQDESDFYILQLRATFSVPEPPEAPYHAHQSMLHFPPGAEAPLHYHGGPGFITILQGELTLFEDGVENIYQAGDSLIETTDKLYKGGNYTDDDTVLMVTYLVPDGEEVTTIVDDPESPEPPEIVAVPLAETMQMFHDPPGSFDLIHTTASIAPGNGSDTETASGDVLLTVVTGNLDVSIDDETRTISAGNSTMIAADQDYELVNTGDIASLIMSTELAPGEVYSVAPATGSNVDRTFVVWLVVLTASTLLVVGGVLRLTEVRTR